MKKRLLDFFMLFLMPTGIFAQSNHGDLAFARFLCDKSPLVIESLPDAGQNPDELKTLDCFPDKATETNTYWLSWIAAETGDLNFTILPLLAEDDIDFALFELPDGLNAPANKTLLRCMASGKRLGEAEPNDENCTGATGLRSEADSYNAAPAGCPENSSAFLKSANVEAGKAYALMLHNFHSSSGLQLEFGGTAAFLPLSSACASLPNIDITGLGNGKASFSKVYPDPASGHVSIDLQLPYAGDGYYQIIDARGSLLRYQALHLPSGTQRLDIATESLANGIYFLKIRAGDAVNLARFVKN